MYELVNWFDLLMPVCMRELAIFYSMLYLSNGLMILGLIFKKTIVLHAFFNSMELFSVVSSNKRKSFLEVGMLFTD